MTLTEAMVEAAALGWFEQLGYALRHGPDLAPGEPAAERESFADEVLVGRLREAIRQLNSASCKASLRGVNYFGDTRQQSWRLRRL